MTVRIAHLGLRNLRSYRAAELTLHPGTTLLTGDIGSGKTSILYAMELALFGFAEVDPSHLVRHGAPDAEVTLTLTDGTTRWELRRRFARKHRKGRDAFEPTENSLAVDGQRASYSATELRRQTIELLGFPDDPNPRAHSDVWRWAVYLAQERMRDVLDPDVDVRMETVRKALGVEQYRLAAENARGVTRALQEQADSMRGQAARHRGVEQEVSQWMDQSQRARERLQRLERLEGDLRLELERARSAVEGLETIRRESAALREAVTQQERLADEMRRSIEQERQSATAARQQLVGLESELRRASSLPRDAAPAVASLRTRRESAARQLAELDTLRGQATGISEQRKAWDARDRELRARQDSTRREHEKAEADRRDLETSPPTSEPQAPDSRTAPELAREQEQAEEQQRDVVRRLAAADVELAQLSEIVEERLCPRCHRPVDPAEFETHRREQQTLVDHLRKELESAGELVRVASRRMQAQRDYERLHDRWQELEIRRAESRQRTGGLDQRQAQERDLRAELDAEKSSLEERRRELQTRLQPYDLVRTEVANLDQAIVSAEEEARVEAARQERVTSLQRQIPEIRAEVEMREREASDRTARREVVLQEIVAARARLPAATDVEARWETARDLADSAGRSLEAAVREGNEPQAQLAEATAHLADLDRRRGERDALDRRAAELVALAEWVDTDFRNAMIELERRRLLQGRLLFERRFAQYFAALVEDPSLSARVDDSFAPWVDLAGESTPAEALSGGERTALALAYRLALGQTVREAGRLALETLILDEPTEGFSQEQTLRMGDLLESLGLPQVILVSHERQLEGIADRVVRVLKKEGISRIEELDSPGGTREDAPTTGVTGTPAGASPRPRRIRRLTDLTAPEVRDGPAQAR